jgi:hypothetical protein
MEVNLFYPAIVTFIITILLFINSKIHDRILLLIMIIGQLILISGESESDKNLKIIEISHILFTITIVIGSCYFYEKQNLYFIGLLILLRFITRYIYNDCLFNLSNQNYEFEFEDHFDFINWDIVFMIALITIFIRLLKNK